MKDQLYDIYGMRHVPFWQTSFFIASMITVLGSGVLVLSIWLYRRYRLKKRIRHSWDEALDQLRALQVEGMLASGKEALFYSRLTTIIKIYFDKRYALCVLGKTDTEFMAYIQERHFDPDMVQALQEIFSGVLYIKFAGQQAKQSKMEDDLSRAIALVTNSIAQD